MSVDEFKSSTKIPLVVVLDNVREIHKTALGAEDTVDWEYVADTLDAVAALKADGCTVLAVEQVEGSIMLGDFVPSAGRRYAVVLGNEVKGVRQDVVDACDGCLEIPQFGTKHSLNVSVTAGIVIWELFGKLGIANASGQ